MLVEHGADVNVKNKRGFTPLMHAEKREDLAMVDFLRAHGAKK